MLFDQNIKTPSHEKIVLSHGVAVVLTETNPATGEEAPFVRVTAQRLNDNDAIRLAAFLNRFFREQHQDIVHAEAERIKASREAKKARYEARRPVRPTGDRDAGPGLEGI